MVINEVVSQSQSWTWRHFPIEDFIQQAPDVAVLALHA